MLRKGVVTALFRTANKMTAVLDSGQTISATPVNDWPPPRSVCMFDEMAPGSWFCLGVLGHRRQVLQEDFNSVDNTIGVTDRLADTHWRVLGTLGTIGQDVTVGSSLGRVAMVTNTANYLALAKDEDSYFPPTTYATWASARVRLTSGGGTWFGGVGLASDSVIDVTTGAAAGDAGAWVYTDSSGATTGWRFQTNLNTGATDSANPGTFVFAGEYDVDIVIVGGAWAAGWVDGVGPTMHTANVPGPNAPGLQPMMVAFPRGAVAQTFVCDWFQVEQFGAFVAP